MNRLVLAALAGLALIQATATVKAAPGSACDYLGGLIQPKGPPTFLVSYPTAGPGALQGAAFLYDNALAAIALIGCGHVDQARRVGDAILTALDHDRFWHDGRLRNAYAAEPLTGGAAKLPGWWDRTQNRWLEDRYQAGSDTGNMAWAMLALLALDKAGADSRYRDGAARIGEWVAALADPRGAGGFGGGFFGHEPSPIVQSWKSTEHNVDLAAAFALLAQATRTPKWEQRAQAAQRFVEAMWDDRCVCFDVGTTEDGVSHNRQLVLDAQIWPLLALPGETHTPHMASLATAQKRIRFDGAFAYGESGGGVWTEGTAFVALLERLSGQPDRANALLARLQTLRGPDGGYYATDVPGLPTGFAAASDSNQQRVYLHLPHLAAAAWVALAERGFNPFTAQVVQPDPPTKPTR